MVSNLIPDSLILSYSPCNINADPVGQGSSGESSNQSSNKNREVKDAYRFRQETVRGRGKTLGSGEIEREIPENAPQYDEWGELNDRKGEDFEGNLQV